ncbi:hypothetical protein [Hydrogenophaga sp. RAC07]|uniref:hypothetical protein n=1 Tax=Hydrogenophaga sp. RAC07 TaxID=1842537 RepID=UPI0012EAC1DD|nr:hypothetical protein [Hydrogenophaga sp. RAC07]
MLTQAGGSAFDGNLGSEISGTQHIGVPSGQEVIIPIGTQLLVSCTDDKLRQEILLAQATHCHLKLDLTVPKVPLTTKLRSLECGLLGLKLVKTEQAARSLLDFQQLALDFGKPI